VHNDPQHNRDNQHTEARLGRLEAIVEQMAQEVRQLTTSVTNASQTPWATLASWAAVIITIGVLAITPLYTQLQHVQGKLDDYVVSNHPEALKADVRHLGDIQGHLLSNVDALQEHMAAAIATVNAVGLNSKDALREFQAEVKARMDDAARYVDSRFDGIVHQMDICEQKLGYGPSHETDPSNRDPVSGRRKK
jgi:hypothetical protein